MSMGKQAAKKLAESETLSVGDLRAMIARARARGGMGTVNPTLTMDRVCGIYDAALEGRDDTEVPKAWRSDPYSSTGRLKPTRDALIVANICRDCGP